MKNQIKIEGRFLKEDLSPITVEEHNDFVVDLMKYAYSKGFFFGGMTDRVGDHEMDDGLKSKSDKQLLQEWTRNKLDVEVRFFNWENMLDFARRYHELKTRNNGKS